MVQLFFFLALRIDLGHWGPLQEGPKNQKPENFLSSKLAMSKICIIFEISKSENLKISSSQSAWKRTGRGPWFKFHVFSRFFPDFHIFKIEGTLKVVGSSHMLRITMK